MVLVLMRESRGDPDLLLGTENSLNGKSRLSIDQNMRYILPATPALQKKLATQSPELCLKFGHESIYTLAIVNSGF